MFPTRHNSHEPYFWGVAMMLITIGCTVFAVGVVEWIANAYGTAGFFAPTYKLFGGLVVISLGYIVLELELLRTQKR
jgi:hypothetical protein